MLHTKIVPRLPFAVRPVPGIPVDLLQPISMPGESLDGVKHAWVTCYVHLLALHALYARLAIRRPLPKLHDLTTELHPVVHRICGVAAVRAALAASHHAVDDIDDDLMLLAGGHEAGWWVVALQASMALGVWYGLAGGDKADLEFSSHVATMTRRILGTVFEGRTATALQTSAHGDGAGDLLAQVAANAMDLGAPFADLATVEGPE